MWCLGFSDLKVLEKPSMDEDEKSRTSKRHSKARGQQSLNSNDHPVSVMLMVRANLSRSIEKQKGREAAAQNWVS